MRRKSTKYKPAATLENARSYALYLLARQMYTKGIIKDKLKQKGYSTEDSEAVINEMQELGYLDDANYADIYFRNLIGRGVYGYYGIKQRLEAKKLPSEEVRRVMSDLNNEKELEIAVKFINAHINFKGRSFAKEGKDEQSKEKLVRMMQNRGFRWDAIAAVLKKLK